MNKYILMASAIIISVLVYLVSTLDVAYANNCKTGSDTAQLKLKNVVVGQVEAKVSVCQKDKKIKEGFVSSYSFKGFYNWYDWFLRTHGVKASGFSHKGVTTYNGFKSWKVSYSRVINVCVGLPSNWENQLFNNPVPYANKKEFISWLGSIVAGNIPYGAEKCVPYKVTYDSYTFIGGETDITNVKLSKLGDW